MQKARELMVKIGQAPIVLKKEIPGFVLNRMQFAIVAECYRLVKVMCNNNTCTNNNNNNNNNNLTVDKICCGVNREGVGLTHYFSTLLIYYNLSY